MVAYRIETIIGPPIDKFRQTKNTASVREAGAASGVTLNTTSHVARKGEGVTFIL